MSEMSRRAEDIGFTYAEVDGSGVPTLNRPDDESASTARSGPGSSLPPAAGPSNVGSSNLAARRDAAIPTLARPSSRIWQAAANAGLFNGLAIGGAFTGSGGSGTSQGQSQNTAGGGMAGGPSAMMSRQEILASLKELQRKSKMEANGDSWMAAQGPSAAFGRGAAAAAAAGSSGGGGDSSSGAAWGSSSSVEDEGSHPIMTHEGLQVYTVGHLLPREAVLDNGSWSVDMSGGGGACGSGSGPGILFSLERLQEQQQARQQQQQQQQQQTAELMGGFAYAGQGQSSRDRSTSEEEEEEVVRPSPNQGMLPSEQTTASSSSTRKLRVRRSTFVPGWAVPPRVLLVDDDAVTRKLSSKFLQVFGCTIDVAVDGVSAVNKMNLEKYDLVLMVGFVFSLVLSVVLLILG